jgi:hypothetical protein
MQQQEIMLQSSSKEKEWKKYAAYYILQIWYLTAIRMYKRREKHKHEGRKKWS